MSVITTPLTTATSVRDVFIAENQYALVLTSGGIDVVDLFRGQVISSGTLPSESLCIAADWQITNGRLYVGTATSGIFDMNYVRVREVGSDFSDRFVQRFTTTSTPPVSSNKINDLDAISGSLLIGTSSGVDFIFDGNEYSTRSLISGSNDVRLAGSGGYWTTESGNKGSVEVNYDLLTTTGTSIITLDFEYSTTSTPSLPAEPPVDLSVSEVPGELPAVAVATPGGAFVFEEFQGNEGLTRNKNLTVESIISVDFRPGAYYDSGFLYAATSNVLRVFDLSNNTVSGTHSSGDSTRGQSLVPGTINIVRSVDTDNA
ncbi:MAG: hypothetical protein GF334_01890 [Candidatus Altiarchaeales archaeon]|nr:hypothetical protein [Candidatus Altiarchaeales archaeon]